MVWTPFWNRFFTGIAALGLALISSPLAAREVELNGRSFTLPDGFELELIAGPPLVDRPIVADFDEQGRLYVADSSGSNEDVQTQLRKKPHRIVRLEDTDGDGRFDRRTVFADRMMFPEGAMWLDGSLYVAAPPSIWKLTDTDGDGVADRRVEWFQGKTLTGCANDLHGPYRGLDGWVYWCKGAFAQQTYERPGKAPLVTRAAHLFRARPDGSGIEPVMTGGMDNPVDVVFTPGGEPILTATFLQHPGGGNRDGLIHAVYGGVFGKVHDVLDGHARTSEDVMPVLTHLGPAAPCGLARYESKAFGPKYADDHFPVVFACLFNLHKVTQHELVPSGATFEAIDQDFLVAKDLDFHPTDVHEDADGSLVVLDTGGWYKLCCPTSQLVKPDVLGAIYRVRRKGAPRVEDPRGLQLDWEKASVEELDRRLGDPRPAVRERAIQTIGRLDGARRTEFLTLAQRSADAAVRRNRVWAAARIDDPRARTVARSALSDPDFNVRQAGLHAIALWRDRAAVPFVIEVLKGESFVVRGLKDSRKPSKLTNGMLRHNQRAAAEALGRIGDPAAVPALLEVAGTTTSDRFLDHSVLFALIEIGDRRATAEGLRSTHPATRRAALVALDQMERSGLTAEAVVPLLSAPEPALREAAWWVVGRHREWAGALAGSFADRLAAPDRSPGGPDALARQLARFATETPIQELLADRLRDPSATAATRRLVLRAMADSGVRSVPAPWLDGLTRALESRDRDLVRRAVATVRALPVPRDRGQGLTSALSRIGADPALPAELRLDALAAIPGGLDRVEPLLFDFLLRQLGPDEPVAVRGDSAEVLAHARLGTEQLHALVDAVAAAGPLEAERLLAAFEQTRDEALGLKLVAALKQSGARSGLRADTLRTHLAKYGNRVRDAVEDLAATLNADAAQQRARLEELLPRVRGGDLRRGQAVFNSPKAACSTCHAIGYLGGKVGPDLTRIGQVRSERDLLEAILFPSASFVRSYEPTVVATRDGRLHQGLVRNGASDEVVLITGPNPNQEEHLPRTEIEEMRPGTVSVMPAGLDQQLSERDLADLIAFLKANR